MNSTNINIISSTTTEREARVRDEYPEIISSLKAIASRLRALGAMTDIADLDIAAENLEWERGVAVSIINAQR